MTREELIRTLVEDWDSGIVLRKDFARFSGGAFAPGTVANADCKGTGPAGRMLIGKNSAYPVLSAAEWLADRTQHAPTVKSGRAA
jgi:hypothetical protein